MTAVWWWVLAGVIVYLAGSVVTALALGRVFALRDGRRPVDDLSDAEVLALYRALEGDRR